MKRSVKMWLIVATVVFAIAAGGFVAFRIAQKPAVPLADIPAYPYGKYQMRGSSVPIDSLDAAVRAHAEQVLTEFAATVEPGHVVADRRFLAGKGGFAWDAIRSEAGGYLQNAGYEVQRAGQTPEQETDFAYILWRRDSSLWRPGSGDRVLAVAIQTPVMLGPIDEQVHVYAYFRLTT